MTRPKVGRWSPAERFARPALGAAALVLVLCLSGLALAQEDGVESLTDEPGSSDAFSDEAPADGGETGTTELFPEGSSADPEPIEVEDSEPARASTPTPDYALRLRELEDRVNELKEEIFRSKSRLVLLRERVLRTHIGGSQAVMTHINDMSAIFDLVQVIYSLDGNQLFSALDENGSLADQDRIEIYNGAIVPGPHNISVEMIFRGNGFGLFSYLEGYNFRLRSSYAFTAEDGKVANLDIIAYEQGGVNQPIEERPDIRYELDFTDSYADDTVAAED